MSEVRAIQHRHQSPVRPYIDVRICMGLITLSHILPQAKQGRMSFWFNDLDASLVLRLCLAAAVEANPKADRSNMCCVSTAVAEQLLCLQDKLWTCA